MHQGENTERHLHLAARLQAIWSSTSLTMSVWSVRGNWNTKRNPVIQPKTFITWLFRYSDWLKNKTLTSTITIFILLHTGSIAVLPDGLFWVRIPNDRNTHTYLLLWSLLLPRRLNHPLGAAWDVNHQTSAHTVAIGSVWWSRSIPAAYPLSLHFHVSLFPCLATE